jgi:hypothetical protein
MYTERKENMQDVFFTLFTKDNTPAAVFWSENEAEPL